MVVSADACGRSRLGEDDMPSVPRPLRASVAMVNHNYGRYVGAAIESALGQTHAPHEVIVVDDGSDDDSREVIGRFGNRVTAISTDNRGQAAGLNTAIERCSGEVVCLLDSDDVMLPTRLERVTEVYQSRKHVQWVFHGLDFVDRTTLQPVATPARHRYTEGYHDQRPWARWGWLGMTLPATSALTFRRDFLLRIAPQTTDLPSPDNFLKFASLASAPGWVIEEALALQGIHDANLYTTLHGRGRAVFAAESIVAMARELDRLGHEALAERCCADAMAQIHFSAQAMRPQYRQEWHRWLRSLSLRRRIRLGAFAGLSVSEAAAMAAAEHLTLHPWDRQSNRRNSA